MEHRTLLRRPLPWMGLAVVGLGLVGWAGPAGSEGHREGDPARALDRVPRPVSCVVPSTKGAAPGPFAGERDGVDGGAVEIRDARLGADVPRPVPPVVETGPQGDRIVEAASGDPFFLGFAAGDHYPPAGERIDPRLIDSVRLEYGDGRPRTETFGFLMLSARITEELESELEALGARLLGFHPHYCLKAALPVEAIDAVAAHPAVRWVGHARDWQKVHPALTAILEDVDPGREIDVYVSLFDSDLNPASVEVPLGSVAELDRGVVRPVAESAGRLPVRTMSNGWQQRALEAQGARVKEYVERIRAFRARVLPAGVENLIALDFVQFVEPDLPPQPHHDESTPMIYADRGRASYDGGTYERAVVGQADTGADISHHDLNHIYAVGWDLGGSPGGPFSDGCTHGTHVLGTMLGNGDVTEGHRGCAPGLGYSESGRVYIVKLFDDSCGWIGASMSGMLGIFENGYTSGGYTTPRPHVVNQSWGTTGTAVWIGTEADCRALDQSIFDHGQLHVFSAANEGPVGSSISEEGSSKNVLTVGNVLDHRAAGDPGNLSNGSSRGPCGDGRWKPNVAAPGQAVTSAWAGHAAKYLNKNGTSMAAPHVAGLAAQLVDHYYWLMYEPARTSSLIMASAMTKDDALLTFPSTSSTDHLNMFGAGRVEAYKAHYSFSNWSWLNWGFDLGSSSWTYGDFTVPTGATRLVVVCTYHEEAASAGASKALVNDFSLFLDQDPIDPAGNTGEWFSHQSSRDNTEVRILPNPQQGPWRWKLYPISTVSAVHASVTVGIVTADTTPGATLTLTASDSYVKPDADVDFTCTVTPDEWVASAVFVESIATGDRLQASTTTLDDGAVTDLMRNSHSGIDVLLGDILGGLSRSVTWTTRWPSEGVKSWSVRARSDNMAHKSGTVHIFVDGTPPTLPTGLRSTTHPLGGWSKNPDINWTWTAAQDGLSGLAGYGELVSSGNPAAPPEVLGIGPVTTFQSTVSTSTAGWYLSLRSVDKCGNWSSGYASDGPYYVDTVDPTKVGSLDSPTHTVGVQSCGTSVTVTWTASTDAHSGLAGYVTAWDFWPGTVPSGWLDTGPGITNKTVTRPSSGSGQYFHIRPRDGAGNWGPTAHLGPFFIDTSPVQSYCTAKVSSQGCQAGMFHSGAPDIRGGDDLRIRCSLVINNKLGILFWGQDGPAAIPFQGGWLCVQPPTKRTSVQSSGGNAGVPDCSGTFNYRWTDAYTTSQGIGAGDAIHMQYWYRDPASPSTTGLSDGLEVIFCE